jgi:aryl carrier-like protein
MNLVNCYGLCADDRTTHLHSPIHATSPTDLTNAFLSGASVHFWDIRKNGLTDLASWLIERRITVLHWVPTLFRALSETVPPGVQLGAIRLIVLGSEPVTRRDLECYRRCFEDSAVFINRLGSVETENTRLFYADKQTELPKAGLPCGYAVPGREVLLVDEKAELCSPGEIGEIIVRSRFLAQGYWNRPDLTDAAFSMDGQTGMRTFRTRDLGIMSPDGCLTYHGRKDHLFKVRGQFVDPLEVESALTRQAGIQEAVVVGEESEDTDTRLVAYLKMDEAKRPTANEISAALRDFLPGYMVPGKFIRLDEIPLSAVGKVERMRLARGEVAGTELDVESSPITEAPASALEETLIAIWERVLGISGIDRRSSFLGTGGDSLKMMMFLNRIRAKFDQSVHITAVFDAPTIAEFAEHLVEHYAIGEDEPSSMESGSAPDSSITPESLVRFQDITLAAWSNKGRSVPASPQRNPRAIFILAPPRSGTTLMRVMLGGSPELFAPPELNLMHFLTLSERQAVLTERLAHQQEGTVRALMEARNCDAEVAKQLMADCVDRGLTIQQFYGCLQDWAGDRILVDKTPEYSNHIDTLRRAEAWFEDALYIHLLRHPCGQVVSYEDARLDRMTQIPHNHTPRTLGELLWNVSHRNILDFLSEVSPDRHYRVTFEELVKAPVETSECLAEFLQIDFHTNMSDPYVEQDSRMTDGIHSLTKQLGDEKFTTFRQIDPSIAERWRAVLSPDSLSEMTWDLAESLGYEKS